MIEKVKLEDRVKLLDGFSKYHLEEGVVKQPAPLGLVYVQLDRHEEGKLTICIPDDLKVIA